ncbi:MAG: hypothetical protein GXY83_15445 [Rhodopirellula sp.]|nr:hypothetical protein [Rhodopirellula sp.]
MKRLIERLVAVFRTVLGCFGFGGGASSSSAGERVEIVDVQRSSSIGVGILGEDVVGECRLRESAEDVEGPECSRREEAVGDGSEGATCGEDAFTVSAGLTGQTDEAGVSGLCEESSTEQGGPASVTRDPGCDEDLFEHPDGEGGGSLEAEGEPADTETSDFEEAICAQPEASPYWSSDGRGDPRGAERACEPEASPALARSDEPPEGAFSEPGHRASDAPCGGEIINSEPTGAPPLIEPDQTAADEGAAAPRTDDGLCAATMKEPESAAQDGASQPLGNDDSIGAGAIKDQADADGLPSSEDHPEAVACTVRSDVLLDEANDAPFEGSTPDVRGDASPCGPVAAESPGRTLKREKTRSPRRPPPAEDAREFLTVVPDISMVAEEYARWNSAVVEQVLLAKAACEDVYLCVNPRILAWAYGEAGFDVLTPEEAEQRFAAAVGSVYRRRVLEHDSHLRVLRRCGDDGSPDCAAFLAASVLAAYRMQSDEELSGNAYYRRLADLLGCDMSGTHPVGFSPRVFESLWVFLRNWLDEAHGRRLATRRSDAVLRYVALPLAHVPLRSLDIEKLPAFFVWAGYEPGSRVRRDRLCADLRLWQQSRNSLTQTGAEALLDDRSEAVVAQVSAELESWDGSASDSLSRRSALVEVHFDIVQRQPVFAYLPRRPSGFPVVFDDGEHVFEASDEGWYDPARIVPEDGELLASGFEWRSGANCAEFTLRRSATLALALTPSSNYSGFLSSRRVLRGVKCSVLCRHETVDTVEEYLSEVAQARLNAVNHPSLPQGWSIIRDFTAQVHVEAPGGLESLEVDSNVNLVVSGGLRIGRRWSWVAGAPPGVLVTGLEAGQRATVNGAPVGVSPAGELMTNGLLDEPGEYLIEAGRVRRRIEVLNPQVPVHPPNPTSGSTGAMSCRPVRIALPKGSWTLIGAAPGEVCRSRSASVRGSLASCPFRPLWAVQVGAGPGASVAVLARPQLPRRFTLRGLNRSRRRDCERWAGVIYDANIRRPHFLTLCAVVPKEEVKCTWKQYAAAAKEIKRVLKGT